MFFEIAVFMNIENLTIAWSLDFKICIKNKEISICKNCSDATSINITLNSNL